MFEYTFHASDVWERFEEFVCHIDLYYFKIIKNEIYL